MDDSALNRYIQIHLSETRVRFRQIGTQIPVTEVNQQPLRHTQSICVIITTTIIQLSTNQLLYHYYHNSSYNAACDEHRDHRARNTSGKCGSTSI